MSSSAPKESELSNPPEQADSLKTAASNPSPSSLIPESKSADWPQLQAIFEAVSDGIVVFDMDGHVVMANEAIAHMTGYARGEEMYRDLSSYDRVYELRTLSGEAVPLSECPASKVLRGESLSGWELRGRRKDTGQEGFFSFSGAPVRDAAGRQILAVVIERDITIAKRAEAALRRSEERFRTLADNISPFAWMADANGWIFWYNRRWYEYTGTNLEEMQGWGWQKIHHPDHVQRVLEKFKRSLNAGEAWEDVFPLRGEDGRYRWFLSRAMPIRDEQGKVVRWFGTNTDITEQREAEEALRASEERLRAFVNASSDVVYRMSADWQEMRELDGRGFVSDIHKPSKDWLQAYVHPEDQPKVLEAIRNATESKQPFELEHRVNRVDGSVGWALSRAVPLLNDVGEVVEWFGAATDVTARKQAEEGLIRSEKLASVGRMAATVAHEINNPLAAVMNLLYLARSSKDCPQAIREDLSKAEAELKRVSHITRQVLGFHRESVGQKLVSVGAVVDEAVDLFEIKIAAKRVNLEKEYGDSVRLMAVAGELRQILANLIANSLDAVSEGGTIRLRVGESASPGAIRRVCITVSDNGAGIEPEALPYVFEPLFTTKESVGTGLGLWVSRQLVEKHGGSIRFRSSTRPERRGTTFRVILPSA